MFQIKTRVSLQNAAAVSQNFDGAAVEYFGSDIFERIKAGSKIVNKPI